jgi:hypothetical protein
MSTKRLLGGFSISLFLGATVAACAPATAPVGTDQVDTEEENLGASQRSYVVARRDYRKCAWPMCSGWFVRDVNRKNPKEVYVSALDFADSDLDEATADIVRGAPDGELVMHGKLGDLADWEDPAMKVFRVKSAWRGMPGQVVAEGEVFYEVAAIDPPIQCVTAPCATTTVKALHKSGKTDIDGVSLEALTEPLLDHEWLQSRLAGHGALAAGSIVDGEVFPGGTASVLAASQVFVRLPEVSGPCPQSKPACDDAAGEVAIYERDADRCVVLSGCTEGGACAAYVPSCSEGYGLVSWTGGMFACTVYACDPAFLLPELPEEPAEEPVDG